MRTNPPKMRSGVAVAAMHRNSGGPMHHRLQPRGGARNAVADLLEEADEHEEHETVSDATADAV